MKVKELVKQRNGEPTVKSYKQGKFKKCESVSVDLEKWEVVRDGQVYELDEMMYTILVFLIKNEGRIVRYKEIEELRPSLAMKHEDGGKIICIYMGRLRRLLEREMGKGKVIVNKRGIGYKLVRNWRQEIELKGLMEENCNIYKGKIKVVT